MGKKIGDIINVRMTATYDKNTDSCDDSKSRGVRTETITKVMSHGVKTKESGYVNNNRLIR